jgi:hypothetical protein
VDTSKVDGQAFIEEVGGSELHLFGYRDGYRYHAYTMLRDDYSADQVKTLITTLVDFGKSKGLNITIMPSIDLAVECAEARDYAREHPAEVAVKYAERIVKGWSTTKDGIQFRRLPDSEAPS